MTLIYLVIAIIAALLPYVIKSKSKSKSLFWLLLAVPIDILIPIGASRIGLTSPIKSLELAICILLFGLMIAFPICCIKAYMKPMDSSIQSNLNIIDYLARVWFILAVAWITIITVVFSMISIAQHFIH